jgi:L-serine/L-threonine ammonia-lyase
LVSTDTFKISRIFLKLENLQPSGSFKSRGIGNLVLTEAASYNAIGVTKPLHFFASSGGNAGLATVKAASTLGYRSSVVVPEGTEQSIMDTLVLHGATDVIIHGAAWYEADTYLREVVMPNAEARGEIPIHVPPFDKSAIWEGASTIIEEISGQMASNKPDAIVCSVGGGGLLNGIMGGLDRVGWTGDVQVLAAETKGADSLHRSLQEGELITLPKVTSIAKSLGIVRVPQQAFDVARHSKNVTSLVLEDAEAAMGCWRLADDERLIVEPACGVSVALVYDGRLRKLVKDFSPETKVVIVVCGGSKISLDILVEYKRLYGPRARELGLMWQGGL